MSFFVINYFNETQSYKFILTFLFFFRLIFLTRTYKKGVLQSSGTDKFKYSIKKKKSEF